MYITPLGTGMDDLPRHARGRRCDTRSGPAASADPVMAFVDVFERENCRLSMMFPLFCSSMLSISRVKGKCPVRMSVATPPPPRCQSANQKSAISGVGLYRAPAYWLFDACCLTCPSADICGDTSCRIGGIGETLWKNNLLWATFSSHAYHFISAITQIGCLSPPMSGQPSREAKPKPTLVQKTSWSKKTRMFPSVEEYFQATWTGQPFTVSVRIFRPGVSKHTFDKPYRLA